MKILYFFSTLKFLNGFFIRFYLAYNIYNFLHPRNCSPGYILVRLANISSLLDLTLPEFDNYLNMHIINIEYYHSNLSVQNNLSNLWLFCIRKIGIKWGCFLFKHG